MWETLEKRKTTVRIRGKLFYTAFVELEKDKFILYLHPCCETLPNSKQFEEFVLRITFLVPCMHWFSWVCIRCILTMLTIQLSYNWSYELSWFSTFTFPTTQSFFVPSLLKRIQTHIPLIFCAYSTEALRFYFSPGILIEIKLLYRSLGTPSVLFEERPSWTHHLYLQPALSTYTESLSRHPFL